MCLFSYLTPFILPDSWVILTASSSPINHGTSHCLFLTLLSEIHLLSTSVIKQKVSLTPAINFKDSLLLLFPSLNRTPALATGAWRRLGRESTMAFFATAEGHVAYWLGSTEDCQYFFHLLIQTGTPVQCSCHRLNAEVKQRRVKPE